MTITTGPTSATDLDRPAPRLLRVLAAGAVAATVPYAALKVAWLLGSRAGLNDPSFGESTTMHVANGLTLLLDVVAAALALTFVSRRGRRAPAALVSFPMWVGAGLLGEILLVMPLTLAAGTVGSRPSAGVAPIDGWVYAVVYAGFCGLGLCLLPAYGIYAWLRWRDRLRTRLAPRDERPDFTLWFAVGAAALAGLAGLGATRLAGPDAGRWMLVDAVLGFLTAGGLAVLAVRRPRVRVLWPVAAAFVGSGALFAWGAFHATLALVPNDLVGDEPVPAAMLAYALGRVAAGALGGWALARWLRASGRG